MQSWLLDHAAYIKNSVDLGKTNPAAPFGAVLVDRRTGVVVSSGVNQSSLNPTLHGEIAAINDYVSGGTDWHELTLYTTAEPAACARGPSCGRAFERLSSELRLPN